MKKFRWILLAGLLVTVPQLAQAQPGTSDPRGSSSSSDPRASGAGSSTGATGSGGISNATVTTETTVTPGIAPGGQDLTTLDNAAFGDPTTPTANTGGEPMLVVMAGLSIAAMALVARRKVTA